MVVVFDLDNTLFYNSVVDDVCEKHNIVRGKRHDLTDLPDHVRNECFQKFGDVSIMGSLKLFDGAYDVVNRILSMGHEVHVVTSRDNRLKNCTLDMVYTHLPHGIKITLVGSYDKYDVYSKLKADIVIDDFYHHINEAKMAKVPYVVMVSNKYTPYNHEYVSCVENLGGVVIENIKDFGDIFNKLQKHLESVEFKNDVQMLNKEYSCN